MPDQIFIDMLTDNTLDLAIMEGYSYIPDVGGRTMEGICQRWDVMKTAGCSTAPSSAWATSRRRPTIRLPRTAAAELWKRLAMQPEGEDTRCVRLFDLGVRW